MTAENRLPDFIEEMVRSATDALTFTEGMDEKSFLDDIKTQRAVVMCLMIIGEAANRIVADFPDFARENQNIPWNDIRGIRNRIAHGYFKLNLEIIWFVVENDLAPLKKSLEDSSIDRLNQTAEKENSSGACP